MKFIGHYTFISDLHSGQLFSKLEKTVTDTTKQMQHEINEKDQTIKELKERLEKG